MKKKILIATHSIFAEGIKKTLELILGEQPAVSTLCAYTDGISEIETPVKEIISHLKDDEELIIATDLFGGSVNNEFMKYLSSSNIHLIAGINFPLLVELVLNLDNTDTAQMIQSAVSTGRDQLLYCNALLDTPVLKDTF